jgi:predicted permease
VIRRRWKFLPRNPLVVVQIAFSLALLTAAALFIRGASKAASVNTGLQPGASFLVETDASLAGYETKRAQDLYRSLNERLAALPGVEHASVSATIPFGMISLNKNVQRAGLQAAPDAKPATAAEGLAFSAAWNSVGADYFATVGLPVLRGRAFNEAEATQSGGAAVAIIDEVLAKKLWPDGDALGQQIQFASDKAPRAKGSDSRVGMSEDLSGTIKPGETIEVVGVVPATRNALFENDPNGAIYVPFGRGFQSNINFFVRFRSLAPGSETATADLLRRTVREVDSALPILMLKTFAQHLESNFQLWIVRAGAAMFSVFGGLALGLAVVGLYGVKAYSVARRTREIGIRMALGAQRGAVLRMFLREGSVMLVCGLGLGLLLAAGTGKVLSGMLYEVGALDPIAFITAPALLATAALVATWLPARRATRISPMAALRME